ncbi:MAG TPA: Bax inhibitor-1/YccA family protein [Candidatus Limnocylindria bacterium]|nr:Bax inhibitor-1/YccA family protein [Candidatus Limnocylindria bacterium]
MTFQNTPGGTGFGQSADQTVRVNGVDIRTGSAAQGSYLTQAFFWMFAGLLLTAAVAALVQFNPAILRFVASNFLVILIAQFALVMVISFGISRLNATVALGLFFVYAASLGFTVIALVMQVYTQASIATAFISAAAMFGGAALYGYTTKRSLAGIGRYLMMALFGLIAAVVVNVFVGNSMFDMIISIFGVGLFTVLTAFHVQRIASGDLAIAAGSVEKAAVLGALLLYLDFINLFLFLLRLFGDRR